MLCLWAHTVCEKRGYILEVEVTAGNVHDSVAFDTIPYKRPLTKKGGLMYSHQEI